MSLRDEGDADTGTKASAMFVHLGSHDATVIDRIGQVVASLETAKQELRSMSKEAAMVYAVAALGVSGLRSAAQLGTRHAPACKPRDLQRPGYS